MICKEKIDKIERILNDEYEAKIERIREVVEAEEDTLKELKQAREEISEMRKRA